MTKGQEPPRWLAAKGGESTSRPSTQLVLSMWKTREPGRRRWQQRSDRRRRGKMLSAKAGVARTGGRDVYRVLGTTATVPPHQLRSNGD